MLDEADLSGDGDRTRGLVDPDRLGQWMDAEGLPGSGEEIQATFVTGGASNELFEIQRGEHRWALRRPPRMVPEGRNETMLREYRILKALADSNVPHPAVRAVCAEPSVLGATFYLMDFVDGWSPIGEPHWPEPFGSDLGARQGLAFELVDAIAQLSRVDWRARGLEGLGRPDGFHDRQVDRWYAHLSRFEFREIPGLDEAGDWLRGHRPRNYHPGIMHGDYQFANVMFHHGGPARLAAIVDWEMGTVGDPLLDLAWVVMGWPDEGEVLFEGKSIGALPMHQRARRGIGYLTQEPSVFRKLTVEQNILAILETCTSDKLEQKARLKSLLEELDLTALARSKAFTLCGGEKRRLEITRALVTSPRMLLLDEPFSGIDPIAVYEVQKILRKLKERRMGVLITDHNVRETLKLVDRAYIIHKGDVRCEGEAEFLVNDPTAREIYLGPDFNL